MDGRDAATEAALWLGRRLRGDRLAELVDCNLFLVPTLIRSSRDDTSTIVVDWLDLAKLPRLRSGCTCRWLQ